MYWRATSIIIFVVITESICINPLNIFEAHKLSCPNVSSVESFNISAFGVGVWYEIARFPNPFEVLNKCVSASYENNGESFKLTLRNVSFDSIYAIEATVEYADSKHNGNLDITFSYGWPVLKLNMPVKTLAVKYDQYAIFYTCFKEKLTGLNTEYAWILSRRNKLEDSVKTEVENTLKTFDFFDSNKLIWIDHSDLICKVKSFISSLNPLNKLKLTS